MRKKESQRKRLAPPQRATKDTKEYHPSTITNSLDRVPFVLSVPSWCRPKALCVKMYLYFSSANKDFQRKRLAPPQRATKDAKEYRISMNKETQREEFQRKRQAPPQSFFTKNTKEYRPSTMINSLDRVPFASFAPPLWVPQEPCVKMYLYLFLFLFSGFAFSQSAEDSVDIPSHALIGRFQGDSIELRWAPATFSIWQHAVENGWKLERLELSKSLYNLNDQTPLDGDENMSQLGGGLLFPWNEEQWKARVSKTDTNTAAALQLLYGENAIPTGSDPLAAMAKLQEEQSRRHGFAMMAADFSKTTASALGLRFVDKKLTPGKAYLYRIYIPVGDSELDLDTMVIVVDTRSPWSPKPVQKVFTESGDEEISVNWPALNDAFFTAYDIERSTDQKSWKRLNHKPYVVSKANVTEGPGFFIDTTLEKNYKTYFYRVRGYSPFGDKGLYSATVSAIGKDFKAPAPAFDIKVIDLGVNLADKGMNTVKISWGAFATEKDLKGFYVGKSNVAAGEFPKISGLLSPNTREFVDAKVNPIESNYYAIIAVDTSGNESQSYVAYADLQDTISPEKPTGLVAEIDTFGNVFLNWNEGKEMDIIGYRVYWANDKNAEFSQITGDLVPGLNYVDSIELNTLTEHVYYRVAAVDHRYNHSEMSDIMELQRPDKVKPTAPVITGYQISTGQVSFQWIPSSSADVVKQEIQRKSGEGNWEALELLNGNSQAAYTDNAVENGKDYGYRLLAIDDVGNASEASFPLQINMIDNSAREGISGLAVVWNKELNAATLSWTLPKGSIAKVLLYRNTSQGLTYYRTLPADARSFADKLAPENSGYAVKLVYADGFESSLSGEVVMGR